MKFTIENALEIVRHLEPKLAEIGYHTALTGGCLYRGGSDKDVDIILYPHIPTLTVEDAVLHATLEAAGFVNRYETDTQYVNRVVWIYAYKLTRVDFFIQKS